MDMADVPLALVERLAATTRAGAVERVAAGGGADAWHERLFSPAAVAAREARFAAIRSQLNL
jgi:hypothetical protein